MGNLIEKNEMAQFLSIVIKKISKDRLSAKEIQTYKHLKDNIDPDNKLEDDLTLEWKKAEDQSMVERVLTHKDKSLGFSLKTTKNRVIKLVGKVVSFFMQ